VRSGVHARNQATVQQRFQALRSASEGANR